MKPRHSISAMMSVCRWGGDGNLGARAPSSQCHPLCRLAGRLRPRSGTAWSKCILNRSEHRSMHVDVAHAAATAQSTREMNAIFPSHYSERQSLGASPSFGVFDNALPADSLTLYMAPGRGCWPTAPGQPSAPASREGPGGVAARGWWSVRERLIGMCRTACRDGRVMWMSPLRHGGQPA